MANTQQTKRNLTLFGFFSLTASMVLTVYEYPTFATSKLHLIFFLILGGLFWFIPVALCAAEMATVNGWKNYRGLCYYDLFHFRSIFIRAELARP